MKKQLKKQTGFSLVGNLLLGIGVVFLLISQMGADPYSSLILGLKQLLPSWSIGMLFFSMNVVLFLFGLIFCRSLIGLGTIVNLLCIGFVSDGTLYLGQKWLGVLTDVPLELLFVFAGVGLLSFGAAVYFSSNLGVAPYDLPSRFLEKILKIPYRYDRMITDFICLLVCFVCGGQMGWGSVISVLCIGPLIQFFTGHVTNRWLGYSVLEDS